jgi:DNA-binding response OmpR family regulator
MSAPQQPVAPRVLVVEDSLSMGDALRTVLQAAGYESEIHTTAVAALTAARARPPDTILLDLNLPGALTGDAAMPALIRLAPVIVVTGSGDDALKQRLLDLGAFGYMRKPFDLTELLDTVKAALSARDRTAP